MSIWLYPEIAHQDHPLITTLGIYDKRVLPSITKGLERQQSNNCTFCDTKLQEFTQEQDPLNNGFETKKVKICPHCGWWTAIRWGAMSIGSASATYVFHGSALLKEMDLTDVSIPLAEVEHYLLAKYKARFKLSPKLMERIVADVFKQMGYQSRVTAFSNDGGIDVILDKGDETIGVQVKRYRNKIKVEQIRQLVGALVLARMTKGMIVTTSDFQRGAEGAVQRYNELGYRVKLINADRFFSALQFVKRTMYRSFSDFEGLGFFDRIPLIGQEVG